MAALAWSDVVNHAAALSPLDAEAQTDLLAYGNGVLVPNDFGGETGAPLKLARIYLAAHFATLAKSTASASVAGPVTSESGGGLSRSYGTVIGAASSLGETRYGRMFAALLARSPGRGPVVL